MLEEPGGRAALCGAQGGEEVFVYSILEGEHFYGAGDSIFLQSLRVVVVIAHVPLPGGVAIVRVSAWP